MVAGHWESEQRGRRRCCNRMRRTPCVPYTTRCSQSHLLPTTCQSTEPQMSSLALFLFLSLSLSLPSLHHIPSFDAHVFREGDDQRDAFSQSVSPRPLLRTSAVVVSSSPSLHLQKKKESAFQATSFVSSILHSSSSSPCSL